MDKITPAVRSRNMAAIHGKDTRPEMVVRRLLHSLGYRYRLHRKDLPGKPDIVFAGRKKAIQINGCFWHQHAGCKAARIPLSRLDYWRPKLTSNVARDRVNLAALQAADWEVLTLWECEVKRIEELQDRLVGFLGPPAG